MTLETLPAVLEPMVEKAAQAIYEADFEDDIPWWGDLSDEVREPFRHRARAALSALTEAGWVVVRKEEIEATVDALQCWGAYASDYFREKHGFQDDLDRTNAMLSAAPAPK